MEYVIKCSQCNDVVGSSYQSRITIRCVACFSGHNQAPILSPPFSPPLATSTTITVRFFYNQVMEEDIKCLDKQFYLVNMVKISEKLPGLLSRYSGTAVTKEGYNTLYYQLLGKSYKFIEAPVPTLTIKEKQIRTKQTKFDDLESE